MNKNGIIAAVLVGLIAAAGSPLATPARAADCPSGEFCVWTDAGFRGQRANWSGDDHWWESWISDKDSSWANHGISGPGIKDHVQVFSSGELGGHVTICLGPGQEVNANAAANDDGDSHTWTMGC
ncbi:peptidase inhibitor family I36 protein [Actinomadura barringtoniae]|uniref:Peptidase inhibitor family I36 protein n=1 Tax=Actinomadura barringtoniae TaxID=1427535 RepID=A0A939T443_9ACTN|nr:peptidase inhibitor family I36 protein [Actinomadura barringtoniae]MBO2452121.1 peptidase inhibitor family I36 protein [Actinomadura barringtoniae]